MPRAMEVKKDPAGDALISNVWLGGSHTDPMEGAIGDVGEERCAGSCQRVTRAVILHLVVKGYKQLR